MLEPDVDQIEIFTDALFRRAGDGFVSLRAFFETDSKKPYQISAVSIAGDNLGLLNERSAQLSRQAANHSTGVVFCPPIATFNDRKSAKETDIKEGLALSVECDQRPREALRALAQILGPPTIIVRSGGKWVDPSTGETHDKLHLHWRLAVPARGDRLKDLKQARDAAARLVGGDPSNKPVCHPIRWAGTWHRKGEPILCSIDTANPDNEIDLAAALTALKAAAPHGRAKPNGKATADGFGEETGAADWTGTIVGIISGADFHHALVSLAAKMTAAGMSDGAAVNMLRGLMEASTAPHDGRWATRFADIPRAVETARQKFGQANQAEPQSAGNGAVLTSTRASKFEMSALEWLWPNRFALGKLGLIVGLPDVGKGQVLADMAARVTRGNEWPLHEGVAPLGNVILLSAEDAPNDTVVPRLAAAGADLDRIEIVGMVKVNDGKRDKQDRMFSLITDLALLRQKIADVGDVRLVQIDPISAYLGVGKMDSFRTSDVRAVLAPLCELAEQLAIAIVGIMHFNKKVDVTNALLRISDSLAFGATARHVFAVVDDPDNKRKLFVKAKNNLASDEIKALAYTFDTREVGHDKRTGEAIRAPHIVWQPEYVDVTASEAMQAATGSNAPTARDDAKTFLRDMLVSGAKPAAEIEDAAEGNGISRRTLNRAKKDLGVLSRKNGLDGGWMWSLPDEGCQPETKVA